MRAKWVVRLGVLIGVLSMSMSAFAQDQELLATIQAGGHVALMRHSTAPGSDDPPNFRLDDCSTQRNLSAGGRAQAVAIGERLREAGIGVARIVSSQWCRCLDTAQLLALGDVEELPALNSLINYPGRSGQMTEELRDWIHEQDLSEPVILVTHQVNISRLLGVPAQEGEILVVRVGDVGELSYIGSLSP